MRDDMWRVPVTLVVIVLLLALTGRASAAPGMDVIGFAGTGVAGGGGDGGGALLAQLRSPSGVAVRPSGAVFIADGGDHRVRQVDGGLITAFAGTGATGNAGDGGPATAARLVEPVAVAVRPSGTVLIADAGSHTIRQVEDGIISTTAGVGVPGYTGDGGPASSARLRQPRGVAVRPSGEAYIADTGNHVVRRIDHAGTISTVAGRAVPGYSGDGAAATGARLRFPAGVTVTPSGEVYIADTGNHVIRRIDHAGVISTVAGSGAAGYSGDGGPATAATLREPAGVAIDGAGGLLIADAGNHVIRRVDPDGSIRTIAGTGTAGDGGNGGPAETTPMTGPRAVAVSGSSVLIAESGGHRVRVLVEAAVPAPVLIGSSPVSPSNRNDPRILGHAPPGSTVRLYDDSTCASAPVGGGSAETLSSPGLAVTVADDTTTSLFATAIDAAGRRSICSGPLVYVEDSIPPPAPQILSAPDDPADRTPTWTFTAEAGASTACRLATDDAVVWNYADCRDIQTYDLTDHPDGRYTFTVRATDAAGNAGPAATSTHDLTGRSAPSPPPEPPREAVPAPAPGPAPAPASDPAPAPAPEPAAVPERTPAAVPTSQPSPTPTSEPAPIPQSEPAPAPAPAPSPGWGPDQDEPIAGSEIRTAQAALQASPPAVPSRNATGPDRSGGRLHPIVADARTVAAALARDPGLPIVLLVIVGLFLAVQHRIDRSDPKLALAPVHDSEQDFPQLLPVRTYRPASHMGASPCATP